MTNLVSAYALKHWREAATLILVSPSSSQSKSKLTFPLTSSQILSNNDEQVHSLFEDYSVLMVKRNSHSKFMPNSYVYPGGVATNQDFSHDWLSIFKRLGENVLQNLCRNYNLHSANAAPMLKRKREPQFSQIPSQLAFRITAIRETFEESGVLLAVPTSHMKEILQQSIASDWSYCPSSYFSGSQQGVYVLSEWRERVNKNPDEFLTMCIELDIIPAVWTLHEWSNFLTPKFAKSAITSGRRFDTLFFICCLDHKPDAFEDTGETVDALWIQPSVALRLYYENKFEMSYPQVYESTRFLNFTSYKDMMKYAYQREPQGLERWTSFTFLCHDYVLNVMPGDDLYPKESDESNAYILSSDKTFEELCQEYPCHHRFYNRRPNDKGFKNDHSHVRCQCNVKLSRGQVGPVPNMEKQLSSSSKL